MTSRLPSSEAADEAGLCSHCQLPLGAGETRRSVHGEARRFCCYGCCLAFQVRQGVGEEAEAAWLLLRLGIGGFFAMNVMVLSLLLYSGTFASTDRQVEPWILLLLWILATPVLLVLGGPFLRDAWEAARCGSMNASTLIALGATSAYAYSAVDLALGGKAVYFDTATMLLLLFTLGRYLEALGRARAVRSLAPLLEAEGLWATLVDPESGQEERIRASRITAGALVRALPGERLAVDGRVVEGRALLDEAVITGESRQLAREPGDAVLAGSILIDGPLLIRATRAGDDTRWARICRSVRAALARRSPIQRLADRAAGLLVPLVLLLAAAAVLFWSRSLPLNEALLVGLAVLVVACPCGLGLATPMAASLALGRLARQGCLLRGGAALEALSRVRVIAFDKTGTLTLGRPHLVALAVEDCEADEALNLAAALERGSEHGLARGVLAATRARGLDPARASQISIVPGRGIRGEVGGLAVAAGSGRWISELGLAVPEALRERASAFEAAGHSLVQVGWDGALKAVLAFEDELRPEAAATLAALRRRGFHIALLSGDRPAAVERVAAALGIEEWRAELGPDEKAERLQALRARHGSVAMVGDGVNDGPVLASADVGVAVGSATDLARETADLVLPPGSLAILPWVLGLARAAWRTIVTSLLWVACYNAAALTLAMTGLLQPVFAAALMAGSSLFVVLNSLRLERLAGPAPEGENAALPQPKRSSVKARYQPSA